MSASEAGTMFAPLRVLFNKGVRYSTVIDVGCADGHFFLALVARDLVPGAVPLNIEANALYENSLLAIKNVVGGHFRISAIADREGEVELTTSVHPYWSSLRPADDRYWQRINKLSAQKVTVPATTLDTLRKELSLEPPFILKLDVQGAEEEVLSGANDVLKDTHVVICEADVDDFQTINKALVQKNFVLYDVVELHRLIDGTLGWFYPVYISRALDFVRPKGFWDAKDNETVIRAQGERRKAMLNFNAEILARIQNQRQAAQRGAEPTQAVKSIGRNDPCPCRSGKKYKRCCGAYR